MKENGFGSSGHNLSSAESLKMAMQTRKASNMAMEVSHFQCLGSDDEPMMD